MQHYYINDEPLLDYEDGKPSYYDQS